MSRPKPRKNQLFLPCLPCLFPAFNVKKLYLSEPLREGQPYRDCPYPVQYLEAMCKPITIIFHPHLKIAAPQVSPAPNPEEAMISPGFTLPWRTASSRARGMDAAEVLP
jgi:hypothetical protein